MSLDDLLSALSYIQHFNFSAWYLFLLGCLLAVWLFFQGLYRTITAEWRVFSYIFFKHLAYPHVFPRLRLLGAATRWQFLIAILFLGANIIPLVVVGVRSKSDLGAIAATLSVANLTPLLLGPRLSLVTRLLGVTLRTSIGGHQWIGRTAVLQAALHAILTLASEAHFSWSGVNISGIVGITSLGIILFTALHFIRYVVYEIFLHTHVILTLITIVGVWYHVPVKKTASVFIRICVGIWTCTTAVHGAYFVFRNFVFGKPFAKAVIKPLSQDDSLVHQSTVLQIDITVPRSWHVSAGQYIFLFIPKTGLSGLRGHPFMISWWSWGATGLEISLLVESRGGFTAELEKLSNQNLLAFIDGPFGPDYDFGEFGTVIMFATGIGIAGHLPYLKDLVRGYNHCEVKTRRILLVWQIKEERHSVWIKHWMDQVLDHDTGYILEVVLYAQDYLGSEKPYGTHDRIKTKAGQPHVEEILEEEFHGRRGKTIISVCANNHMSDHIRTFVQVRMNPQTRLVELDFKPSHQHASPPFDKKDMDFKCSG